MCATVRMWRWRRNPLRRRSDVMEAWVGLAVGVVMVLGAPMAGWAASDSMRASLDAQNAGRHAASAVLVANAPSAVSTGSDSGTNTAVVQAPARWTGPDGSGHTGSVPVTPGARSGTTTPVWLDAHGRLTDAPLSPSQTAVQADLIGAGAAGGFCLLTLAGQRSVRAQLDRHRASQWEREWAKVGPQWSSGHRA
ncbi:Rv1733c family protein [Streptantibioticus parmotrematis]|nr:hypothetical protein [Streptantibioticus parmotrematis]